jgi:PTH1 family peptidyl-tRNA hydrolase
MSTSTRLIVGLGNPGPEHVMDRHNIGFMALDAIAVRYELPVWKRKFKGQLTVGTNPAFLLLKPETFMNLSGEAVGEAMRFHKMVPDQVIVFHDDLDLQPGQVRIKQGGGSGGHNGIKSIDAHIGPDYWRVRLGIGHPGVKGDAVSNYVLGGFAKADHKWLEDLLIALAGELELLLAGKMTEYSKRVAGAKSGI